MATMGVALSKCHCSLCLAWEPWSNVPFTQKEASQQCQHSLKHSFVTQWHLHKYCELSICPNAFCPFPLGYSAGCPAQRMVRNLSQEETEYQGPIFQSSSRLYINPTTPPFPDVGSPWKFGPGPCTCLFCPK